MDTFIIVWCITIGLAIVNTILLIYGLIQRKITWIQGLVIVALAIGFPFLVAYVLSATAPNWEGMGRGILGYIYSGFILMIGILIFLIRSNRTS